MNLHIAPHEVVSFLIARINRAGLLSSKAVAQLPTNFYGLQKRSDIENAFLGLLGHGWRHDCMAEPVIYCPAAVVIPCDLSLIFRNPYRQEFQLLPPEAEILPRPYFLYDIRIYHPGSMQEADMLLRSSDWRELNLLECACLLAQSCADYHALPRDRGLGSLTTRQIGIPMEGSDAPLQLHVLFHGQPFGVCARVPMGEEGGRLYTTEHNHHVAICRERFDPLHSREIKLGRLAPVPADATT